MRKENLDPIDAEPFMNKKSRPEITEFNEHRLSGLDADDFAKRVRKFPRDQQVVTLLMPMERRGAETRKNHIIFKNLLNQAGETLAGQADGSPELASRLAALESLEAPTHEFWQNQDEGLAMVVEGGGRVTAYKVPFALDPYVSVGRQPYLSPLLRLSSGTIYHILALDLNELKLYRASAWQIDEIQLADLPTSLAEAMKYDDPEESLQWQAIPGGAPAVQVGGGPPFAGYHGHGVTGDETRQIKIKRFMEMIDRDLASHFDNRERPLALLGPPSEVGLYRTVNSYPHLLEEWIPMNPSSLSRDELRDCVCDWIRRRDLRERKLALAALDDSIGVGAGSAEFAEVVKAAADGRVSTLFVQGGERRYGVNDRRSDTVVIHEEPQEDDEELVEASALAAAEGGALIHYLESDEGLPQGAPLAAIFRY